jgi:anaerobic ribonucleoside-triphosphate reductase activating protein
MLKSIYLSVAAFLEYSHVNGPGARSALWVQGCPFRCPGCFNPAFLEFNHNNLQTPQTVADWILQSTKTEGVTFSGGEPFAQAQALAVTASIVQKYGKSVVVFTGYTQEQLLNSSDQSVIALLNATDLLIAGPYLQDKPSPRPLLASANQTLTFLTDRYRNAYLGFDFKPIEFTINAEGDIIMTGFPKITRRP